MKIKEILELTQSEPLNKIAKERLEIGEKPTREALKKAGCFNQSGKRGWFFNGDESVLEQSIYDFAPPKKINRQTTTRPKATTRPNANVSTNVTNEQNKKVTKEANELTREQVAPTLEQTSEKTIVRKRSSFDIDVELMKELKIKAIIHEKNVYEIVETAIRKYLKEL